MNDDPNKILTDALQTMNVPDARRGDLRWLARNLAINNAEHPNLLLALHVIKVLLKEELRKVE